MKFKVQTEDNSNNNNSSNNNNNNISVIGLKSPDCAFCLFSAIKYYYYYYY
jgi:hypothetical protein